MAEGAHRLGCFNFQWDGPKKKRDDAMLKH